MPARRLPADSRIRVTHMGRAHSQDWAAAANAEAKENSRYVWRGEIPHWQVRREFARTRLMVISSNQEGGANVVSEAVVAGVPVLASDIAGNVGLLGADYPGYFPVGDERALAEQMLRVERDPKALGLLEKHCRALAPGFTPQREAAGLRAVLARVRPAR